MRGLRTHGRNTRTGGARARHGRINRSYCAGPGKHKPRGVCPWCCDLILREGGVTRYEYARRKADRAGRMCHAGGGLFARLYWKLVSRYWESKLARMPLYEAVTKIKQRLRSDVWQEQLQR
jgi:hypothetical protein